MTTIVPNFPDAIICSGDSINTILHISTDLLSHQNSEVVYKNINVDPSVAYTQFRFNSDGTYKNNQTLGWETSTASCVNKSISQHYTAGTAFDFVGGSSQPVGVEIDIAGYVIMLGILTAFWLVFDS